ncbi:MAG: hypothetical protein EPO06_12055 [Burkholderiaceae bacterium]|nr:MAG: hypothetical protein EPO06_12055 [Burkholderiaceae bacterium]
MTYFVANRAGIAAAMRGPQMVKAMERRADAAAQLGELEGPIRTGRYRYGKFLISVRHTGTGRRHRRRRRFIESPEPGGFRVVSGVRNGKAWARLVNVTPYAWFLEKGTRYMRAQHVVRRLMHKTVGLGTSTAD